MKRKLEIGILSGKGGVGKTSITASLGIIAEQDPEFHPALVDCDVDAPDLHLLLKPKQVLSPIVCLQAMKEH